MTIISFQVLAFILLYPFAEDSKLNNNTKSNKRRK